MKKIIGISLIKNEDIFVERAIENVIDFCDKLIILDNNSNDDTWSILSRLANKYKKINLMKWEDHHNSHLVIDEYIGGDYWIFGVDGDEIYDPKGLKKLKPLILNANYDNYFNIKGQSLHCSKNEYPFFYGYMHGAKSICKLYNFSILKSWNQRERLHHGRIKLKNGLERKTLNMDMNQESWDNSFFRCLHMCFMKRSSLDLNDNPRQPPLGCVPNNKLRKYKKGDLLKLTAHFYENIKDSY